MAQGIPLLHFSRRTRLLLAALVWSGVGVGLGAAGTIWVRSSRSAWAWPLLAAAFAVGWVKGRFLLAPRAAANAERIGAGAEHRPLHETFSAPTWALVAGMMGLGFLLRHSGIPRPAIGWVYVAIGAALLFGSGAAWTAWSAARGGGG